MIQQFLSRRFVAAAAVSALSVSAAVFAAQDAPQGEWALDSAHSSVVFRVRHAGASPFYGRFDRMTGSFTLDESSPENSLFNIEIDLASVNTGAEGRDNHLRSPDFFSVKQFPKAAFTSTSVERTEGDVYKVVGELNLHGETREIVARVEKIAEGEFRGSKRMGLEVTFEIKRTDFGMNTYVATDGSESGMLGNTVRLMIGLEGMQGGGQRSRGG